MTVTLLLTFAIAVLAATNVTGLMLKSSSAKVAPCSGQRQHFGVEARRIQQALSLACMASLLFAIFLTSSEFVGVERTTFRLA
jgi:hypothetical protein